MSLVDSSPGARSGHAWLLALLFWLAHLEWPRAALGLDETSSLRWALTHFRAHGLDPGVDWISSSGPLAFVFQGALDPKHPLGLILARVFLAGLLCAAIAARAVRATDLRWARVALIFLWVVLLRDESQRLVAALWLWAWTATRREPTRGDWILGAALCAMCALVDVGLVVCSAACVLASLYIRRDRGALIWSLATVGLWLAVALAVGSSPAGLLAWLRNGWEFAAASRAYEAVALPSERLWLAVLFAMAAFVCWRGAENRGRPGVVLPLGALGLVLLRHQARGLFSQDYSPGGYFPLACLLALAAAQDWPRHVVVRALGVVTTMLLAAWFLCAGIPGGGDKGPSAPRALAASLKNGLTRLVSLPKYLRSQSDAFQAQSAQHALPTLQSIVGNDPVDVVDGNAMWPALQGLEWRPRPVFQAQRALRPDLQHANLASLQGERAPRWVIVPAENRFPVQVLGADGDWVRQLARTFEVHYQDANLVLLERVGAGANAPGAARLVLETRIEAGQNVALPQLEGEQLLLRLDVQPTLAGRLQRALFALPLPELALGKENGDIQRLRVDPQALAQGLVIDPLLTRDEEWVRWWSGGAPRHSLWLEWWPAAGWPDQAQMRLFAAEDFRPRSKQFTPHELAARFDPPPDQVAGLAPAKLLHYGPLQPVCVTPPGRMVWKRSAGRVRLTGGFGLLPVSLAGPAAAGAKAGFRVLSVQGDAAPELVFERFLAPAVRGEDARLQELDLEIVLDQPGRVVLETQALGTVPPAGAYWLGLKFESLP